MKTWWWELKTLEKCKKHQAAPCAPLCRSLMFLKIPMCLCNWGMHLGFFFAAILCSKRSKEEWVDAVTYFKTYDPEQSRHFFDGLNYSLSAEKPKSNGLLRKKNTKQVILKQKGTRMAGDGEDWNGLQMMILKSLAIFFIDFSIFDLPRQRWYIGQHTSHFLSTLLLTVKILTSISQLP